MSWKHKKAALTRLNLVVRASNDTAVDGRGGDGHLIDFATLQFLNVAGVGGGVTGGSVAVSADGPGSVVIRAWSLCPGHIHLICVAINLCYDIFWETRSCEGEFNHRLIFVASMSTQITGPCTCKSMFIIVCILGTGNYKSHVIIIH